MASVIQQNVPLAQYTTLKVGGVAGYFVVVREVEEVRSGGGFFWGNGV
jgi:UDP-N-acetylenolpyruvoylglucosamine reductase